MPPMDSPQWFDAFAATVPAAFTDAELDGIAASSARVLSARDGTRPRRYSRPARARRAGITRTRP
jgi:hypothetical protein